MNFLHAIILGIVQGITEWFPVSSSGHLVILQNIFKLDVPIAFDVALHFGSLIVIVLVFYKEILKVLKAIFTLNFKGEYGRLFLFIIIGSLMTFLIGFVFHDVFTSLFNNLLAVGIAFLLTGTLLFFCEKKKIRRKLNWRDSLFIGVMQGIALMPGISRSGSTIGIGLFRGIDKKEVIRYVFLLFIPAVIGAMIYEIKDLSKVSLFPVLIGTLVSVIVGYISLKLLLRIIMKRRFYVFSYYCWLLGIILLLVMIL